MSPDFYVTFWSLSMCDLYVPKVRVLVGLTSKHSLGVVSFFHFVFLFSCPSHRASLPFASAVPVAA